MRTVCWKATCKPFKSTLYHVTSHTKYRNSMQPYNTCPDPRFLQAPTVTLTISSTVNTRQSTPIKRKNENMHEKNYKNS